MSLHGCRASLPILLIEHDMDLVFRFARRVIVLVAGAILFEGTPAEVAANQDHSRYLSREGRAWRSQPLILPSTI